MTYIQAVLVGIAGTVLYASSADSASVVVWTSNQRHRSAVAKTVIMSMAQIAQAVLGTLQQPNDTTTNTPPPVQQIGGAVIEGIAAVAQAIAAVDHLQPCPQCGKLHTRSQKEFSIELTPENIVCLQGS